MLKFKNWPEVYTHIDDENLNEDNCHIEVMGEEYIGEREFLHGINWRKKSEVDRERDLIAGRVQPETEDEELCLILYQEIQKELNQEVINEIIKNAKT